MKRMMFFMALTLMLAVPAVAQNTTGIEWGHGPFRDADFWRWPNGVGNKWQQQVEKLLGANVNLGTGSIYYVDSNVTLEGSGNSWTNAKDTLDEAIGLCTADNGDVIFVAQGHTELMAVGSAAAGTGDDVVDVDKAGVTIIGCGTGKLRPLFDYTGDVTGSFAIGADDVSIYNFQFRANILEVNEAIEIEAGSEQVTIANCLFYCNAEGTDEFLECIDSSGGAASDRTTVIGCEFDMAGGLCNSAICLKDSDYALIQGNTMHGDYAVACFNQVTTASNHIVVRDNFMFNGTIGGNAGMNAQPCIEVVATTTGFIANNYFVADGAALTNSVVAADMFLFENYTSEDESQAASGALVGAASVAE